MVDVNNLRQQVVALQKDTWVRDCGYLAVRSPTGSLTEYDNFT